jgi:hypothetical protein
MREFIDFPTEYWVSPCLDAWSIISLPRKEFIQLDKFLLFLLKETEEAREHEDSGLISKKSAGSISELLIIYRNRQVFLFVKWFTFKPTQN